MNYQSTRTPGKNYLLKLLAAIVRSFPKILLLSTMPFINAAGIWNVETFAGTGGPGGFLDSAIGLEAEFYEPWSIATHGINLYVSDYVNNRIRLITTEGAVSTYAGSGAYGETNSANPTTASFVFPTGLCFDPSDNLYVCDHKGFTIRKISSGGTVTTFAGTAGTSGSINGTGTAATFNEPISIAMDSLGNFYVADSNNNKIRKITSAGVVTTFAGTGTASSVDNTTSTLATFNSPYAIAVDSVDNLFVAESKGNKIRKITNTGAVTTFAGTGTAGFADGASAAATFNYPSGLSFDRFGNLFIADCGNKKIRMIANGMVTTIAGTGVSGAVDGTGLNATFNGPSGLAFDSLGNLFVTDSVSNLIRKLTFVPSPTISVGPGGLALGAGILSLIAPSTNPLTIGSSDCSLNNSLTIKTALTSLISASTGLNPDGVVRINGVTAPTAGYGTAGSSLLSGFTNAFGIPAPIWGYNPWVIIVPPNSPAYAFRPAGSTGALGWVDGIGGRINSAIVLDSTSLETLVAATNASSLSAISGIPLSVASKSGIVSYGGATGQGGQWNIGVNACGTSGFSVSGSSLQALLAATNGGQLVVANGATIS